MNGTQAPRAVLLAVAGMCCALLPALAGVGCREGDSLDPGLDLAEAEFVPETRPPAVTADYVSLRTASVDGGRIVLDLVVSDISVPVSGVAVKLTYPGTIGRFVRCLDGELFPSGACFYRETAPGSGEVYVGRVIQGPSPAVSVSGDRVALRLEFLVFAVGQGPIAFQARNLGGSDASAVLDANGVPIPVDWFAGTIAGM